MQVSVRLAALLAILLPIACEQALFGECKECKVIHDTVVISVSSVLILL